MGIAITALVRVTHQQATDGVIFNTDLPIENDAICWCTPRTTTLTLIPILKNLGGNISKKIILKVSNISFQTIFIEHYS